MKKYTLLLGLLLCLVSTSYAERRLAGKAALEDSANGVWINLAMSSTTATYTSSGVNISNCSGFTSLIVYTSSGSIAVDYQVSLDNTNWFTPYDVDGSALNTVYAAITDNIWIEFDPTLTKYIRFVFTLTVADSTVSAYILKQE